MDPSRLNEENVGAPAGGADPDWRFYSLRPELRLFDELLADALRLPSGRGELALGRIGLLGLAYEMRQAEPSDERIRRYERLIDKSDKVMSMMLKQRVLSGDAADGLLGAVGQALDELGLLLRPDGR
jgi:hypothetical protein